MNSNLTILEHIQKEEYQAAYTKLLLYLDKIQDKNKYLSLKGFLELKLKKIEESKVTLKASLSYKQTSDAWRYLAEVYANEKFLKNAYKAYKMSYNLKKDPDVYNKIVAIGIIIMEYEDVKKYLNNKILESIVYELGQHYKMHVRPTVTDVYQDDYININKVTINKLNLIKYDTKQNEEKLETSLVLKRHEYIQQSFVNIKQHNFIGSLECIRMILRQSTLLETIDYIVTFEWIYYLYKLLIEFYHLNYCMLSLKLVNVIKQIQCEYRSSFIDCLYYLLGSEDYDRIYEIGVAGIEMDPIFYEAEQIKTEIEEKHNNCSLEDESCNCSGLNHELIIFNKFFTGKNYFSEK